MTKKDLVKLIKGKIQQERHLMTSSPDFTNNEMNWYVLGMKHVLDIVESPNDYED